MPDTKERAQEAYNAFSSFANSDRMNSELVSEAMTHDHPLLQAYTLGIMLDCIKAMANNDHVTPQNEAAVKLCKEIQEVVGDYPQYL